MESEAEVLYGNDPTNDPSSPPIMGGVRSGSTRTMGKGESGGATVSKSTQQNQRIDFNQLTFSAMRNNPVYALFVLTILYWLYRIIVTMLYPMVRPPIVGAFEFIHKVQDQPLRSPFLTFAYTALDLIHRLFERVIYPIVCVQILDRVFVIIMVVIFCMLLVWMVWKYVLVWPIKDIFGAILQSTPPFNWAWGFFDQLEQVIFGSNTTRVKALAQFIGSGLGLVGGEATARMNANTSSSPTPIGFLQPSSSSSSIPDAGQTILQSAVNNCAANYAPYTFTDPFSQIMVRNELIKCDLNGLEAYYRVVQPSVADAMAQCAADAALFAKAIPAAEFVSTDGLVSTISAPTNTITYDSTGNKLVRDANGTLVAQQSGAPSSDVLAVLDASGNTLGYLDAKRHRVVPSSSAKGTFVPITDNLAQTLLILTRQHIIALPHYRGTQLQTTAYDPMQDLLTGDSNYIACQIAALQTSNANVSVQMETCADGATAVPDPQLSTKDVNGSVTNATNFASAASASQASTSSCHNTQGTKLAKSDDSS